MNTEGAKIKICQSNRIVNEPLENVDELFFAKEYRQADWTLAKIIQDSGEYKEELCLDVLAFLGGRGRGKTSAMCSFFSYLEGLQKENEWSEVSKKVKEMNLRFLTLPYIDAAMLAEAEYIIDVILAEMWDEFEIYVKKSTRAHEANFERLEREIKQKFIDVRKAYLLLKEREEGESAFAEKEVPVPSALHELASGVNLQQKFQSLIDDYLSIFEYEEGYQCYLVIAIDDVDMSGKKAHYILEQIRRFLCMKRVVVLVTADIDRLQTACESRYKDIYDEKNDRRKFINEYLEKVLPYNMRIYMPEIRERHDNIAVETEAKEVLGLHSEDEKNMILECMVNRCGIYFDGARRKRHFLQNQSMRSMVNYFEQMIRMKDNCLMWLKVDLKERIIERIIDTEQKNFMNELLARDYEDVNNSIITYIGMRTGPFGQYSSNLYETSMGQVLHLCRIYEDFDARNTEFVNAVILLYSIIMQQVDDELKQSIIGESLWGETEYGLISAEYADSPFCTAFDSVGALNLTMEDISERELRETDHQEMINSIVTDNRDAIVAWLCCLLFVGIDETKDVGFDMDEHKDEYFPWMLSENWEIEEEEEENDDNLCDWFLSLQPRINARKSYLSNAFGDYQKQYTGLQKMLMGALRELSEWLYGKAEGEKTEKKAGRGRRKEETYLKKLANSLLNDMKEVVGERHTDNGLENHVEILYNIGKRLQEQGKTDEASPREAYRLLSSSYKIIEKELDKRDQYFKYEIKLERETKFASSFKNSPQAKLLLQDSSLTARQRELFEEKLGNLLIEYRYRRTILPSSNSKSYNL